jgi:autotransporter-associated beta strand protein
VTVASNAAAGAPFYTQTSGTLNANAIHLNDSTTSSTGARTFNLNGGRVNIGSGGIAATGNASAPRVVNLGAGTLGARANWTSSLAATLTSASQGVTIDTLDSVDNTTARNITLSGVLSGSGKLVKAGAGVLTLSGANTYSGSTEITGGTLLLNGSAAGTPTTLDVTVGATGTFGFTAGSATTLILTGKDLTLNGGTLAFDIGNSGVNDRINVEDFILTANSALSFTSIGAIDGTYTLIESTNDITNSGPYTLSGQTVGRVTLTPTINAKTVTVTSSVSEGKWNVTGGGNWSDGDPNATAGNWLEYKPTVDGDAALFGDSIAAPSVVLVDTPHTVSSIRFDNANSYTIGASGGNNLTVGNTLGAALISNTTGSHTIAENMALTSNLSILPASGTALTASGLISGAARNIAVNGAGNVTVSGVIATTTGTLSKDGTGLLTLSGANTYTGATSVAGGILTLSGARTGASGALNIGTVAGQNATLNISAGTYAMGGNSINTGNSPTTAATATVNQSGGAISFTSGNAVLVGQNTVGNTGIYNLSGGSITTFASTTRGVMIGVNNLANGTFNLSGTGVLNMTAASGGGGDATLLIGRHDAAVENTTSTFHQTGGTANVGILSIGGNGANGIGLTSTMSLTGGVFSANQFPRLAAGNTNTAAITIGGTAQVTLPAIPNAKGTSSTATITFDSTTGFLSPLVASATYMPAGTFTTAALTDNGAKINVPAGRDITIGQVLSDAPSLAGTLTKDGVGNLSLSGVNLYTGATTINEGTLTINEGSIGSSSNIVNYGALAYVLSANPQVYSGSITGTGSLTKSGTNALTLSGANAYSGGTTLTEGTLTISGAGTLGSGAVSNAGTLTFSRSDTYTLAAGNLVTGAGAVVLTNDGTVASSVDGQFNTTGALIFGASANAATGGNLDLTNGSSTFAGLTSRTNSLVPNTIAIGSGKTLTINGNIDMTNSVDASNNLLTMTGGGTLSVNGVSVAVGRNTGGNNISGKATLDMSGLATFTANLSGNLIVQQQGDNEQLDLSQLILANTSNSITATNVIVGGSATGAGTATSIPNKLLLGGGTNVINAALIHLGSGARDSGYVEFTGATGSITLRNAAGTGRANLTMGPTATQTTAYQVKNLLDTAGHTADLAIGTFATAVGAKTGANTHTLKFDTGTLDILTVNMAVAKGTGASTSRMEIRGGSVFLGGSAAFSDAGTGAVTLATQGTGELLITGGVVTSSVDIVRGIATAGSSSILTINGGTLDMSGNNIGSAVPIDVLNLQSGVLSNVGQINNGAAIAKTTTGTLTLTGTNTYNGDTTVSAGTLALVGGSQASKITVSADASLGFTLDFPTTSTSTFDLTNGTIKITGTPTLPSYTLISSSAGITGTPVLHTAIPGYSLRIVSGALVLENLYKIWETANGVTGGPSGNDDTDPYNNLMEYAFGTDPKVNSSALLAYSGGTLTSTGQPILVKDAGVWYAVFGRRKDYVEAGLTYTVEFSSSLAEWVDGVAVPEVIATDGTIDAVRVQFPNFIEGPSGQQKPTFFRVKVTSSF